MQLSVIAIDMYSENDGGVKPGAGRVRYLAQPICFQERAGDEGLITSRGAAAGGAAWRVGDASITKNPATATAAAVRPLAPTNSLLRWRAGAGAGDATGWG